MPFFYRSGEQIKAGDRVRFHGEAGEIEFVADALRSPNSAEDDPQDWFVKEGGGGMMISEPKVFGRVFIHPPDSDFEDLEFVSRGPDL